MSDVLDRIADVGVVLLIIWLLVAVVSGRDLLNPKRGYHDDRLELLRTPSRPARLLTVVVGFLVMASWVI